jgi:PleD family two-component response regulator
MEEDKSLGPTGRIMAGAFTVGAVEVGVLVVGPAWGAVLVAVVAALVGERVVAGRRHRRELAAARRLARTDELTGLGNRRAFVEGATEALGAGSPMTLLLVDLDDFKAVNDIYGHVAGDQVLRTVADRLHRAAGDGCVGPAWAETSSPS